MVEILEKCLIVGIGLVLASTLLPTQYNIIEQAGRKVLEDSYSSYARELDDAVWRTYDLGQDNSLNMVLQEDAYITYGDNILKIVVGSQEFHVGRYPFHILVQDTRSTYGRATLTLSRQDGYILVVVEDAE